MANELSFYMRMMRKGLEKNAESVVVVMCDIVESIRMRTSDRRESRTSRDSERVPLYIPARDFDESTSSWVIRVLIHIASHRG